ncbi:hypothetical protein EDD34_2548 [Myceligenerans xiligouense]|uniref:Uncharacterized protein n=2 Tax=Myceligenerans xiligouense TaxID=253184 RepID=A0A3N4ZPX2_9MICO|nr:hypothetical protein EDD34_2548 [Myceligenerans xiligouense]
MSNGPVPVGVEVAWPAVVTEVRVEHAVEGSSTLCGIAESGYEIQRQTFSAHSPLACGSCQEVADEEPVSGAALAQMAPRAPVSEMSERQFLAEFAKRPGMFVGTESFERVVAWIQGYDFHGLRTCGALLDGFHEWLLQRPGAPGSNLRWSAIILLTAFPDRDRLAPGDLTQDEESYAIRLLFELLDRFLDERDGPPVRGEDEQ